jgi:hypothetical protein
VTSKWLYPVYGVISVLADAYYSCVSALKPSTIPRVYIYTDSRGFKVDHWYSKKNPIGSYIARLAEKYNVSYSICRYRHTTLIDFLYDIRRIDPQNYDLIVLHVGIVDFSPRPIGQARSIIQKKSKRIAQLFGEESLKDFLPRAYADEYLGERTASLYSPQVLEDYLLPALNTLQDKLVWIGINPVLNDWLGNYERPRPANINNILEYQRCADGGFQGIKIGLSGLSREEINFFTVDNIHLSDRGMERVASEVIRAVSGLTDA